jgi:hypothetical protein
MKRPCASSVTSLQCPRSIAGGGFARRDKLVDRLESSKLGHSLSHQGAVCQAAVRNMTPVRGVSQAPPLCDPYQNAVRESKYKQSTSANSLT